MGYPAAGRVVLQLLFFEGVEWDFLVSSSACRGQRRQYTASDGQAGEPLALRRAAEPQWSRWWAWFPRGAQGVPGDLRQEKLRREKTPQSERKQFG